MDRPRRVLRSQAHATSEPPSTISQAKSYPLRSRAPSDPSPPSESDDGVKSESNSDSDKNSEKATRESRTQPLGEPTHVGKYTLRHRQEQRVITTRERSAPPSSRRRDEPRRRSTRSHQRARYEVDDDDNDNDSSSDEPSDSDDDSSDSDELRRRIRSSRAIPIAMSRTKRPIKEVKRFADELLDVPAAKAGRDSRSHQRERSVGGGYLESSDSSDSDEYERQARQAEASLMPLNAPFAEQNKAVRADLTPLEVDATVDWKSVGGLSHHVNSLKEMVVFPLMYPELYGKFQVQTPKGVLFHGPPGTGKTLLARALANTCSQYGRKVAFFMRKGADILSKWVGEAERQLRLLFEQARQMQPSIIFFDEIDGLAPVRSSRQDQIHSSIVATLLALLDGLDSRGQVVVIGATNRIDHIDPALRRPGRFDREFLFTLPAAPARAEILSIHTRAWTPPLEDKLRVEIAQRTAGFCGADLKALCAEATLCALRRVYPEIYASDVPLRLRPEKVSVVQDDWASALAFVGAATHRSQASPARPLPAPLLPLLGAARDRILFDLRRALAIGTSAPMGLPSTVHRPRALLCGSSVGAGHSDIAASILHALEDLPVHALDLPGLIADMGTRSPEEAVLTRVREAQRSVPSLLYIPNIDVLWKNADPTLRHTVVSSLSALDGSARVALLATSDLKDEDLPKELKTLFTRDSRYALEPVHENKEGLTQFWQLLLNHVTEPVTPLAPPRQLRTLKPAKRAKATKEQRETERTLKAEGDLALMRRLRKNLRNVILRLKGKRGRFGTLFKPIDSSRFQNYYRKIKEPMDLATIEHRVDAGYYTTIELFEADIALIKENALSYFGNRDASGYVSRSSELVDKVQSYVHRLGPLFRAQCAEAALRVEQGEKVMPLEESDVLFGHKEARRAKRKHRHTHSKGRGHKRTREDKEEDGHREKDERDPKRQKLDEEHHPPPKNALPPLEGTGLNGTYWSRLTTRDENGNEIPAPEDSQPLELLSPSQQRHSASSSDESGSESGSESPSVELLSGSDDMGHRQRCTVCDGVGELLCCDSCDLVYHLKCCTPPLKEVPEGEWHCETCEGELCIRLPSKILMGLLKEIESDPKKDKSEAASTKDKSEKSVSKERDESSRKDKDDMLVVKIEEEDAPALEVTPIAGEDAMDIDEPNPNPKDSDAPNLILEVNLDSDAGPPSPRRSRIRRDFGAPKRRSQRLGEIYADRPPPLYLPPWKKQRNPSLSESGQSDYARKMEKVQQQIQARREAEALAEDAEGNEEDGEDNEDDDSEEGIIEPLAPAPIPAIFDPAQVAALRARLVDFSYSGALNVERLMALHALLMRSVVAHRFDVDKGALIRKLSDALENEECEDDTPIRLGGTLPPSTHAEPTLTNLGVNTLASATAQSNPIATRSLSNDGDAMNIS